MHPIFRGSSDKNVSALVSDKRGNRHVVIYKRPARHVDACRQSSHDATPSDTAPRRQRQQKYTADWEYAQLLGLSENEVDQYRIMGCEICQQEADGDALHALVRMCPYATGCDSVVCVSDQDTYPACLVQHCKQVGHPMACAFCGGFYRTGLIQCACCKEYWCGLEHCMRTHHNLSPNCLKKCAQCNSRKSVFLFRSHGNLHCCGLDFCAQVCAEQHIDGCHPETTACSAAFCARPIRRGLLDHLKCRGCPEQTSYCSYRCFYESSGRRFDCVPCLTCDELFHRSTGLECGLCPAVRCSERCMESHWADRHNNGRRPASERDVCIVCLTAARDTVLLPCSHFCVCFACSQQLLLSAIVALQHQSAQCPICRADVQSVLKVYSA